MPDSCAAYGCSNRRTPGTNLRFFSFPKDVRLRKLWVIAVKRKNFVPKDKSSKICSEHFIDSDYLERPGINFPQLKPDAVPSVFKEFPAHLQPKPKKPRSSSLLDKLAKRNEALECVSSMNTFSACDLPENEVLVSLKGDAESQSKAVHTEISAVQDSVFCMPSSSSDVHEKLPTDDIEARSKRIQTEVSTVRDSIYHTLERKVSAQTRKIRTLQQTIRRQVRKINNLEGLLITLKSEMNDS